MNFTSTDNSVTTAQFNTTMGIVKVNKTFSKCKCTHIARQVTSQLLLLNFSELAE